MDTKKRIPPHGTSLLENNDGDKGLLSILNEYQRSAVFDNSRACLVNANVGSGKTTVLTAKVIYLVEVCKVPLDRIVVLTFTNKAAKEILDRLHKHIPMTQEVETPYFGTFHSVAMQMLKRILPIEKIGFTEEFSIIDPDEELDLAEQLIDERSLVIKYQNRLRKRLERAMTGHENNADKKIKDDIYTLCDLLAHRKQQQNKMNFAELISNAVSLIPDAAFSPDYIIIDEFQDCDDRQLDFIRAMVSDHTHIFAVGDPNQVIYTWRGSKADLFDRFVDEYQATVYDLPVNYRSCNTILEAAKRFLQNGSDLVGVRDTGSKIVVKQHHDPFNEADYLAERITSLHEEGVPFKEIAILYRLLRQSQVLEAVFRDHNIPCTVSVRRTLKDIPVLGWFIQLLRCSANPEDTDSLIHVLTDDRYGCGLLKLEVKQLIHGDASIENDLYTKISAFPKTEFTHAGDLWDYFSLRKYLHPNAESYERDKGMVEKLIHRLDQFICDKQLSVTAGVKEYINSSALFGVDYLDDEVTDDADTVKLMTFHASKGLEFRYVFIAGANQGLIPLRAFNNESDEEEKRLFFVGITRAKDVLEISYWANPDRQDVQPRPSIYLNMIPRRLVLREDMNTQEKQPVQDLRQKLRELIEQKAKQTVTEGGNVMQEALVRYARHAKYGDGRIIAEDDSMITVDFPDYGEKQFVKMFGEVEILLSQNENNNNASSTNDLQMDSSTPATNCQDASIEEMRRELENQYHTREVSYQEALANLQSILCEYQKRETEHKARITTLEKELLQAKQREDALCERTEQLAAEVDLHQQTEAALQQQVIAAEATIADCKQTISIMQNEIQSAHTQANEYQQRVAEFDEHCRGLELRLETQSQVIDKLNANIKEQQTKVDQLESEIKQYQQKETALLQQARTSETIISDYEQKMSIMQTHIQSAMKKAEEHQQKETELSELSRELESQLEVRTHMIEQSAAREEMIRTATERIQELLHKIETGVDDLKCIFGEKKKKEIMDQIRVVKQAVACMVDK